jgi:aryl-alcohol dehydrogenase
MQITAAVLSAPNAPMSIETLELDEPRPTEIVVEIVGTGVCHTDLSFQSGLWPYPLPAVLGHEGAGRVVATGSAVRSLVVGDLVVLSFGFCGQCASCLSGVPAACPTAPMINMIGARPDGSTTLKHDAAPVHGSFVSQSSFASHALTDESFAVKVPDTVPLELAGTLGCGVATGAGAVLNVLQPEPGSTVAVYGMGAVGLSAVAAAKANGCARIVAVDLVKERLALAEQFGATDVVDASEGDAVGAIQQLVPGGVDGAVEASGAPPVLRNAFMSTNNSGTTVLVGAAPFGTQYELDAIALLAGRTVRGCTAGLSNPRVFVPQLVQMWRRGQLPIEAMSKTFALADIDAAVAAAADGSVVKPVVVP